jgi:hypothetical protein
MFFPFGFFRGASGLLSALAADLFPTSAHPRGVSRFKRLEKLLFICPRLTEVITRMPVLAVITKIKPQLFYANYLPNLTGLFMGLLEDIRRRRSKGRLMQSLEQKEQDIKEREKLERQLQEEKYKLAQAKRGAVIEQRRGQIVGLRAQTARLRAERKALERQTGGLGARGAGGKVTGYLGGVAQRMKTQPISPLIGVGSYPKETAKRMQKHPMAPGVRPIGEGIFWPVSKPKPKHKKKKHHKVGGRGKIITIRVG